MADPKGRELARGWLRGRDRFQAWRRTRRTRTRIPEPLWELAVKLVAVHGLHRTAATLKLDYYSLKKRVEAAEGSREKKNDAPFLELPAAPLACVPECVIEFEEGAARWRVRLTGYGAADIAVAGTRART